MAGHISLENLPEETQKEILRKNWQSTDARWQYATFSALGPRNGNRMNQEVAKAVNKGAMYRLLNAFNKPTISKAEDFSAIIRAAMDLFFSHVDFKYEIEQISNNTFRGTIHKCVTNENVRKVGVADMYECGCFSFRAGWYEAIGLNVEEKLVKCLLKGDDRCEIDLTVKDWR